MRRSRLATAVCLLLGVLALALPAGALAGGSAGNQQYTDPFGSGRHSGTTSTRAATTATTPTPTTPSTTTPSTSSSGGGVDPTTAATTSSAPAVVTSRSASGSLPYSGFAVPTAAGLGVVLIAGGIGLRRRTGTAR